MVLHSPLLKSKLSAYQKSEIGVPKSRDSARLSRRAQSLEYGFWILSKTSPRGSERSLGFWNLHSRPADSKPSKSRAEFCSRAEFSSEAEQNSAGLHSCEGEGLISAHLGSWDDPTKSSRKADLLRGFWNLHSDPQEPKKPRNLEFAF